MTSSQLPEKAVGKINRSVIKKKKKIPELQKLLLKHQAGAGAVDDFSAGLLQIPVMLVTGLQPLQLCS